MAKKGKKPSSPNRVAENRRARRDYELGERFTAGLQLHGWEAKSARASRVQIAESFIRLIKGELWLAGARFSPLEQASTHEEADPLRLRKLLVTKRDLRTIGTSIERRGMTCVPLSVFWKGPWLKVDIAIARGRDKADKRRALRDRDMERSQAVFQGRVRKTGG